MVSSVLLVLIYSLISLSSGILLITGDSLTCGLIRIDLEILSPSSVAGIISVQGNKLGTVLGANRGRRYGD